MYTIIAVSVQTIFCYYITIRYWKYLGRNYNNLSNDEIVRLQICQRRDFFWRRHISNIQYLPVLQRRVIRNLVYAILLTILIVLGIALRLYEYLI